MLKQEWAFALPEVGSPAPPDGRPLTESRFNAFMEAVYDAYYVWHIRTGFLEYNQQMDILLGLRPGGLPRVSTAWVERIHPDDRDVVLRRCDAAIRSGGMYSCVYRLRHEDGSYVPVRDRGVMVNEDGASPHMIGAIRDITREQEAQRAEREAAELYRTLFKSALNPAFRISAEGRFLDVNAAGKRFMETSRRQLLRLAVDAAWGAEALQAVRAATSSGAVASLELELELGGAVKALVVTLAPCSFGGAATCFALGTDITDHRSLRLALQDSEASLRRQADALADSNTALRVILEQVNRGRAELERTIADNVETMALPMLGRLRKPLAGTPESVYLEAAAEALREVTRPFPRILDSAAEGEVKLTPREREIAGLIRVGRSTSEIAEALYISPTTVSFHRRNLRRKLGLGPHGPRLATHLVRGPA